MQKLIIPVLLGTGRDGRASEAVAKAVARELARFGFSSKLYDVRDFAATATEKTPPSWARLMKRADGLVIVSPEYNHGYPGELKILLDSAFDEYKRKPCGIVGVSAGVFGGARMMENLIPVLLEFSMMPCARLYASKAAVDEAFLSRIPEFARQMAWWAEVLRKARNHRS